VDIQSKRPTSKGSAESFVGEVWFDVIAHGVAPSRLRVSIVRFSPGHTRRGIDMRTVRPCM
jgi:hypothetical protein